MKGTLLNDWDRAASDAKEMGQEYMVLAFLAPSERKTLDDYKFVCEQLNKAGEVCKTYGFRMGYHNHDFEFVAIDDQVPYFQMLNQLDPKLVSMELDLYWTTYAGQQPVELFKKYPGRFEQWHLKDMDKVDRKKNANIGTGSIDFKQILEQSSLAGLKHYYVEHDSYPGTSWESVQADIINVKAW
jgi:sugar phosphate isomerase/epimerase